MSEDQEMDESRSPNDCAFCSPANSSQTTGSPVDSLNSSIICSSETSQGICPMDCDDLG